MRTFLLTLLAVASLFCSTAQAEDNFKLSKEDIEMVFQASEVFGECAGMMKTMAWILEQAKQAEGQKNFEGQYNGWFLSGAYILYSTGVVSDWEKAINFSESIALSTAQSYKAGFEMEPEGFLTATANEINEKCSPYVEYQASLVSEMRRAMALSTND